MLIDFSVANYQSFKEKVVFTMETSTKHHSKDFEQINTFYDAAREANYVKSSAIIGKNAGGKSNFIHQTNMKDNRSIVDSNSCSTMYQLIEKLIQWIS